MPSISDQCRPRLKDERADHSRLHLCGSACGVHQADGIFGHILGFQGADKQLIVGLVDWVAALEGQHIYSLRQGLPDLLGCCAVEDSLWKLQQLDFAAFKECHLGHSGLMLFAFSKCKGTHRRGKAYQNLDKLKCRDLVLQSADQETMPAFRCRTYPCSICHVQS